MFKRTKIRKYVRETRYKQKHETFTKTQHKIKGKAEVFTKSQSKPKENQHVSQKQIAS